MRSTLEMSTAKSPNDDFSDSGSRVDTLHIDDVPRLTWKLSSPETSDDETDVQPAGNEKSKWEHGCSSKCEVKNITRPHKNIFSALNNYQSTLEEHILCSAITSDNHNKNHDENDTLMDIETEITLPPNQLKENGCTDTWDEIIDEVLAEDRDFSQISTDIVPQIDNGILTLSADEEQEAEQSSCKINKDSVQQQLPVEETPQGAKSNLLPSSSKCKDKLEDLFENETEMMGERLSQTLIISPQASQSELQNDSFTVSTQIQKMQNQVRPKKTAKYTISQPKGRGKNMKKLLSSLNKCKELKIKSQRKQAKKHPVTMSGKNNQISCDRKYRRHNTSLPNNSESGYMLRTAQLRGPVAAANVSKEASQNIVSLKAGVTFARNFGMKNHERKRKSLQQRVKNRVTDLKEELVLWVSGSCQMTVARMRRILVEAKAAKELCTTLLSETKSAIKALTQFDEYATKLKVHSLCVDVSSKNSTVLFLLIKSVK
ncbi:uncharacterized protein LOC126176580 [Schistocerca cancellata]|uniref:uncharacterized protein LOC126176580 n=1 Tax=Schistocerca cancellata TaxID=274614 RepID=UPI0021191CA3|nr:uncharacterized protein LOC126176580 [Schistocerca cancellata]